MYAWVTHLLSVILSVMQFVTCRKIVHSSDKFSQDIFSLRPMDSLVSVTRQIFVALKQFPWLAGVPSGPEWYILHFIAYASCVHQASQTEHIVSPIPPKPSLIHGAIFCQLSYWNNITACPLSILSPLESIFTQQLMWTSQNHMGLPGEIKLCVHAELFNVFHGDQVHWL